MVKQEDRDAAERWGTGPVYNMDHLVQAFARHREQAEASVLAEVVAWLRHWKHDGLWDAAADAIEFGKWRQQ